MRNDNFGCTCSDNRFCRLCIRNCRIGVICIRMVEELMAKTKHKFVFIHVPRTAGTTFKKMLRSVGVRGKGDNKELKNLREMFTGKKKLGPFRYPFELEVYKENKKLIQGHTPLAKWYPMLADTHKFITWVRDPVERMISQWEWWVARGPGGADIGGIWRQKVCSGRLTVLELCKKMPNTYRIMLGKDLSVFDWIGIQEDFNGSLETFSDVFGITIPEYEDWNVKGKNYKIKRRALVNDDIRAEMTKILKSDYDVYYEAKERWQRK